MFIRGGPYRATGGESSYRGCSVAKRFLVALGLVIGSIAMAAPVSAQVLLSDNFAYTNGNLVGQGGWELTGTAAPNPIQVTSSSVALGPTGQDANENFTSVANSGSVYYGIDATISAARTGDYFAHVAQAGTSNFFARLFVRTAAGGFQFGIANGNGTPTYGTTALSLDQEYRVVARYDFVAGAANDTVALFVGPMSATEGMNTPYIDTVNNGGTNLDAVSIGEFNLRQGGANSSPTLFVDDLIVATDFASVVILPVPEPATALAAGAAGLGLAGLARRRLGRRKPG